MVIYHLNITDWIGMSISALAGFTLIAIAFKMMKDLKRR